jgi:hypothetical protein
MDLFAADRTFPPTPDFPTLCAVAKTSLDFSTLESDFYIETERAALRDAILRNATIARKTNLLWLRLSTNFDFFDPTLVGDMLEFIKKTPEKSLRHFPPALVQAISYLLMSVHSDLDRFAELLKGYFAKDASGILPFAGSTFPGLFGFFTLDYYSQRASSLILALIRIPGMVALATEMMRSYLFSMHRFHYVLWETFLAGLTRTTQSVRELSQALLNAFALALPYLTREHCDLLSVFAGRDINAFQDLMIHDVLVPSLELRAPYLTDFICSLKQSADKRDYNLAGDLLALVTSQRVFFPVLPVAPPSSQIPRLAFAMSDRDILVLIEIFGPELAREIGGSAFQKWNADRSHTTYEPFYIEVATRISSGVEHVSVPEIPPEHSRMYGALTQHAREIGCPILTLLKHTPFYAPVLPVFPKDFTRDFDCAVMEQIIGKTRAAVCAMEEVPRLIQGRRAVTEYGIYITTVETLLLDHFASAYLREQKKDAKRRASAAKSQFSWTVFIERYIDPSFAIPTWVAVLNSSQIATDSRLTKLAGLYQMYVNGPVTRRVQIWAAKNPEIAAPLFSLIPRVTHAFRLAYGSRLRAMLDVMGFVSVFFEHRSPGKEKEWQVMYEFLVIYMDRDETIRSMVVWNASVLKDRAIRNLQGSVHQGLLEDVLSGFVTMLLGAPDLQKAFTEYVPSFN